LVTFADICVKVAAAVVAAVDVAAAGVAGGTAVRVAAGHNLHTRLIKSTSAAASSPFATFSPLLSFTFFLFCFWDSCA